MTDNDSHLSDQDLLLVADGELPAGRLARAREHLAACWSCRARMREIEGAVADFVRVYEESGDANIGPDAGSRALLKARLAEASAKNPSTPWAMRSGVTATALAAVAATLLLLVGTSVYVGYHRSLRTVWQPGTALANSPEPDRSLTPGATREVTVSQVCEAAENGAPHQISASVQRRVFQEYGIANSRPENYELDYLITPELGGSDDVRNLWPEPHSATIWNSYVKDALESRLHEMVCDGRLDLVTAQRDISTDWIAAYKKYFRSDKPIRDPSS